MKIVEEYRRRAEECEKIAESAIYEAHGRRILEIARLWRELADQRERMLKGWSDAERPKPR